MSDGISGVPHAGGAPPERHEIRLVAPLLACLLALSLAGFREGWNLVDDALILCRYAANVAAGHGWVFNPGEPVESHSSPFLVFLLSLGGRIGMDLPYLARALGVVSLGALVLLASACFQRLAPGFPGITASLALALDAGLATWAVSGLETTAFAFLVFLLVVALAHLLDTGSPRDALLAGAVAALLPLVRPEGFAVGLLAPGGALIDRKLRSKPGILFLMVGPFLLAGTAITAFRLSTYGEPLPLTVINKWTPGFAPVLHGFLSLLHFLLRRAPIAVLVLLLLRGRGAEKTPALPAWRHNALIVTGLFLIEVLLSGGDWMGRDRLPAPAIAPALLLSLLAFDRLPERFRAVAAGLLIAGAAGTWVQSDRVPPHGTAARQLGAWLEANERDTVLLGVAAAGAVPYYSKLRAVDPLGITDRLTARKLPPPGAPWKPGHMRYDIDRFLLAGPDVIVWEFGRAWSEARLREPAGDQVRRGDYRRELLASPEFRARYHLVAGAPPETERWFTVFRARGTGRPRPDD